MVESEAKVIQLKESNQLNDFHQLSSEPTPVPHL